MNKEQLEVHINTLDGQAEIIRQKIARKLNQTNHGSADKIRNAQRQLHRLEALTQYGRDLMRQKSESASSGYTRSTPNP